MSRSAVQLSEAEREERRARDRERLRQSAEQLLSSACWPEASFVMGFRAWIDLGYCVRKGETAIRIFPPMPVKKRNAADAEQCEEKRVLFRSVSVFDRSQVDPIEGADQAMLELPCSPLTGDSHAALLEPVAELAASLGYTVSLEATPAGVGGWCDGQARRIVVDEAVPANAKLRTLIHETTHALGVDYVNYSREQAEVIVDTVTFIVCASVGLDVSGESVPYVAGWGEGGALEQVTEVAGTIDALARRIEVAIRGAASG